MVPLCFSRFPAEELLLLPYPSPPPPAALRRFLGDDQPVMSSKARSVTNPCSESKNTHYLMR